MNGYYFNELQFVRDHDVHVYDAITGAEIEGFDNGIGGYAVKTNACGIYRVTAIINDHTLEYYYRMNYGSVGQPYNMTIRSN